jgi:hypothetical protein
MGTVPVLASTSEHIMGIRFRGTKHAEVEAAIF